MCFPVFQRVSNLPASVRLSSDVCLGKRGGGGGGFRV